MERMIFSLATTPLEIRMREKGLVSIFFHETTRIPIRTTRLGRTKPISFLRRVEHFHAYLGFDKAPYFIPPSIESIDNAK